jgi:hypothetical protein
MIMYEITLKIALESTCCNRFEIDARLVCMYEFSFCTCKILAYYYHHARRRNKTARRLGKVSIAKSNRHDSRATGALRHNERS